VLNATKLPVRITEPLYEALGDDESKVRGEALNSLGEVRERVGGQTDRLVEAHIKALADPDPGVRARAVSSLGRLAGDEECNVILSAIEDADHGVSLNAVDALGKHFGFLPRIASTKLIQLLDIAGKDMRLRVIDALAHVALRDKDTVERAVDALARALHDPDPEIRSAAAETLNATAGIYAAEAVAGAITDEEPRVKACAIETLGYIGGDGVYEKLTDYLDDPSVDIRVGAANGLGGLGDERALGRLMQMFENDPDPEVRRAALFAVTSLDEDNELDYLLKGLEDSSLTVREYASDKIGFITDPKIVEPLAALLDDYDADVRVNAVWGLLGLVRHDRYDEDDCDEGDSSEAVLAARRLVDEKATDLLADALDDIEDRVRGWAADTLAITGSERAVGHLLKAAKEGNQCAADALRLIEHPSTIEPMLELLKSKDAEDRRSAVRMLGGYDGPQFTDLLLSAISDPDRQVRALAAEGLQYIDDPRVADALLLLLEDEDGWVRSEAVTALYHQTEEESLDVLIKALDDTDAVVRGAAAKALVDIATPEAEKALLDRFGSERPEIVVAAHEFFIRQGIPGSEQIFLDVLEQRGWAIASALAFSGNSLLEDAGRSYYRDHYFPDKPGEGPNAPKWGSDRQD
jgi:HEAT repeat protein